MKKVFFFHWIIQILIIVTYSTLTSTGQKAFPDAVGFGAKCKGAFAGSKTPRILIVDTLSPTSVGNERTGKGSFTWAISRNYPRIILFEVSGYIDLQARTDIAYPYITIAGQTSPKPGITIRYYPLRIFTHDVIIQHLRFRLGDLTYADSYDAFSIYRGPNIIVDHCSFSWAVDENWSIASATVRNVTVSNCISSEALYHTPHPNSDNSYGALVTTGDSVSIIRNLWVHLGGRVPMIAELANHVNIANNLLYNTGCANSNIYYNGSTVPMKSNCVGNVLIRGSGSLGVKIIQIKSTMYPGTKIYLNDNVDINKTSEWSIVTGDNTHFKSLVSVVEDGYTPISSALVESTILSDVGARPWDRDDVDKRIINDVRNRTGRMINSQDDVGGFPKLLHNKRTIIIPVDPYDDYNGNGYTNIEEWLSVFTHP